MRERRRNPFPQFSRTESHTLSKRKPAVTGAPKTSARRAKRWMVRVVAVCGCIAIPIANPSASRADPAVEAAPAIRLAYPGMASEHAFQFSDRLYAEAFGRLGRTVELVALPAKRGLIESNAGLLDGEAGRVEGFDTDHRYSRLVRVPESIGSLDIVVLANAPRLSVDGWDRVAEWSGPVVCQRGEGLIQSMLSARVPAHRIIYAENLFHARDLLTMGRAGFLIVHSHKICGTLAKQFADAGFHRIGSLGTVRVYPFLHERHSGLVPELARVLREMKRDGAFRRIRDEVRRENGICGNEEGGDE